MSRVSDLYRPSLATLTDLYELTMGAGYELAGIADRETVFALSFRTLPFGGGYAVAAGLDDALAILERLRFDGIDIEYLRGLRGSEDRPIFGRDFIDRLAELEFTCQVDAIPEGTVVFANEPLLRVRGPLLQAQLVESILLTVIGFQTLVATKAARVVEAAGGATVLEFGMRRAQGLDGALTAARAAYIGGVAATSNAMAGRLFGIPVRGTHAHSWVQAFEDEQRAFDAYAEAQPDNVTLLVDTYDSLTGVAHAIETGKAPARAGSQPGRHSPGFRRPGLPVDRGQAHARRRRLRRHEDRRLQRPGRAHHRLASASKAPASTSGESGRGSSPLTTSRPWAPSTSSAPSANPSRGGAIRSNYRSTAPRSRSPASSAFVASSTSRANSAPT